MSRGPVFAAYADGALAYACPNCKARPEAFCTFKDGTARHLPCIARIRAAAGQSDGKEQEF